jgi:hypothetical protein
MGMKKLLPFCNNNCSSWAATATATTQKLSLGFNYNYSCLLSHHQPLTKAVFTILWHITLPLDLAIWKSDSRPQLAAVCIKCLHLAEISFLLHW